jgi:hypothetical protein
VKNLPNLKSLAVAAALSVALPLQAADVVIIPFDGPGVGFNDPTPVEPVGGNTATTLGEQRLAVFNLAAQEWGSKLESDVPIIVAAFFGPQPCSPTSGVLASAGPTTVFRDAPEFPLPATWYVGALADSLTGVDQSPGVVDIVTRFNGDIGVNPNCLTGQDWYNGFDSNNDPASEIDLLSVVMHELSHGLGFLDLFGSNGVPFLGFQDAYSVNLFDNTLGAGWPELTDGERAFSTVNDGNLVWSGESVTMEAPMALGPRPSVAVVNNSSGLEGSFEAQQASFGPPLREKGGLTGNVVFALDGEGSPIDGCEPITNNVSGKVALILRGGCAFTSKVLNAQNARAKGVIIINNQPSGLPPMGGFDPEVTIPSVGVSLDTGIALDAASFDGNLVVRLLLDGDFLAGADENGRVRMYAPTVFRGGSSTSHFDISASPNLLMEPFNTDDLEPLVDLDLTPALFRDIGWTVIE